MIRGAKPLGLTRLRHHVADVDLGNAQLTESLFHSFDQQVRNHTGKQTTRTQNNRVGRTKAGQNLFGGSSRGRVEKDLLDIPSRPGDRRLASDSASVGHSGAEGDGIERGR